MSRRALRKQLIEAIERGDMSRVAEIAAADPTIVNAANSHGHVPLGAAIGAGCLKRVEALIAHGADPRYAYHGRTLLDAAAYAGHIAIFRYLVSLGLEPTVHHAAAIGDSTLLDTMLTANPELCEPTAAGGRWRITPLHAAVISGNRKASAFLLERGVPVDAVNHNGHTALALCAEHPDENTRVPMAQLLLKHGANANTSGGHHGGTLLHRAVMHGDATLAQVLLEHGADPNCQDWSGKTPLHHAVAKNQQLVALLLSYAPKLAVESKDGETPVQYARRLQKRTVVRLLEGTRA
ncbi:MAG: ankyrin repeat domain-containing protein [Chloroflexota bacterium]|nr:ankyrin repeat domain-containing protein [Chloroflexota bacterium]MDE2929525.1 ankyrin repeat domain-containing protein [Chloroflexota bacterium]